MVIVIIKSRNALVLRGPTQVLPARAHDQPGGMVASMPMPIVKARNPNRKSVILPMGPPLIDRFAVQVKTPAFKGSSPDWPSALRWVNSGGFGCFSTDSGLPEKYGSDGSQMRFGMHKTRSRPAVLLRGSKCQMSCGCTINSGLTCRSYSSAVMNPSATAAALGEMPSSAALRVICATGS